MSVSSVRSGLAAVALAVGLLPVAAHAQPGTYGGYWSGGTFGSMRLQQSGVNVIGSYDFKGGQIKGQVVGNGDLVGLWAQDSAGQSCPDQRMGSHYWGRFRFQSVNNGSALVGYWGYCGADPTNTWNSHR